MVIAGFVLLLEPVRAGPCDRGPLARLRSQPSWPVDCSPAPSAGSGARRAGTCAGRSRRRSPRDGVGRNGLILVSSLALVAILLGLIAVGLGMVLVLIDGSPEHIDTERFVIGAIAVLVVFHLLGRLGTWRWGVWDVRERGNLRRQPMTAPSRTWPFVLGFLLTLVVFAATSVVALGAPSSSWFGVELDAWLVAIAVSITFIVVGCLAKDIVDNDIAVDQAGGAGPTPAAGPRP